MNESNKGLRNRSVFSQPSFSVSGMKFRPKELEMDVIVTLSVYVLTFGRETTDTNDRLKQHGAILPTGSQSSEVYRACCWSLVQPFAQTRRALLIRSALLLSYAI
jgi:hypothetical protein